MSSQLRAVLAAAPAPSPLVDVPTAAHMLCVSTRYVRLLVARGQMPCVRLGRRVLLRRADLDSVIARGGLVDAA